MAWRGARSLLQSDGLRAAKAVRGGKSVEEPLKVLRNPFQHLETALARSPLKPGSRHFADAPAQPVSLYEQFDAIGKSHRGLNGYGVQGAAGKDPQPVARVASRQPRQIMENKCRAAHQHRD